MKFIILFLLFIPTQVFSQKWIEVTKDKFGNKFFINEQALSNDGRVIRIWTKKVWKKLTDERGAKPKIYYNVVIKELIEFDCSNYAYKLMSSTTYDSTEKRVIFSDEFSIYLQEWEYVVPETVGESVLNSVCERFNY